MTTTLAKNVIFRTHFYRPITSNLQAHRSPKATKRSLTTGNLLSAATSKAEDVNILRSRLPDISIPTTSIYDLIWETGIKKHGNKTALVNLIGVGGVNIIS